MLMCGCEAHENDLKPCSCFCEEHDALWPDQKMLRSTVRRYYAYEVATNKRLDAIEDRLSPPETMAEESKPHFTMHEDGTVEQHHPLVEQADPAEEGSHSWQGPASPRDESDDEHYFQATVRMRQRAEAAEGRAEALSSRIRELEAEIRKWKDRAVVAERRMSSIRTFVYDNLRVEHDGE